MNPDPVARALASLRLQDDDGATHRLGDAWLVRPVVLTFLRHFGCIFCRRRAGVLMEHEHDLHAAGGGLAVVGMGTPAMAKDFRTTSGFRGLVYVDPERRAYEAAGLHRLRAWSLLRPATLLAALRARRAGFRQGKRAGDPWQLGGTLVLAPGDRVLLAWRNRFAEDDVPVVDVVRALRGARVR